MLSLLLAFRAEITLGVLGTLWDVGNQTHFSMCKAKATTIYAFTLASQKAFLLKYNQMYCIVFGAHIS